jgi:hypothetical protein
MLCLAIIQSCGIPSEFQSNRTPGVSILKKLFGFVIMSADEAGTNPGL